MKKLIRRLRLRKGDVLLVRTPEAMARLSEMRMSELEFEVPIVFAPTSVHRLSKEYLQKLIARA
jgi:hypothetical protein